jgi:hypothetical protein
VGQKGKVSHQDFLRYTLSAEGVSTLITGIGLIDKSNDPSRDQLIANLDACQIREKLSADARRKIEERVAALHGADNNFFQRPACGMLPAQKVTVQRAAAEAPVKVSWHTAFAAGDRLVRYEIYRRDERIASIPWRPQISEAPFVYEDTAAPAGHSGGVWYKVRAVDNAGAHADSISVKLLPS